jgi:hypothetical protein
MNSRAAFLVQILLPKETGSGEPIRQQWFNGLLKELTEKFGGATSFIRGPAEGLWKSGGETERDGIAVIEIMADDIEDAFWRSLRERLERELGLNEIVIRAQEIRGL